MAGAETLKKKFDREIKRQVGGQYLVWLPEGYDKSRGKKYPLILFLHGAGERGSDVDRVRIHGPMNYAEKTADFPFIIAAPQCPEDSWWTKELDMLTALLEQLEEEYRIDRERIYLTGLSMGGFGSWELAGAMPKRFAAVAPICGGGDTFTACRLKDVPIWAFHGGKDDVVPVSRTEDMVKTLQDKCKAKEVKLTIYPEAGHDSWTETYNNPELYKWFLAHTRAR